MIEPVEAAMAVIGLRALVSKKVERVTVPVLERVDKLGKEITRLSRDLVNDKLTETFYSDLNYRAMLNDLADGFEIDQVQEMADQFPAEYRDLGLALTGHASQVITALTEMVPRSFYETVTGSKSLLPSDVAVWKFVSILEVLDDPLLIFPLMNTGALLKSQAHAVRELYPTFSAAVDAALFDAAVKAKAAKKSFELSPRAEVGVHAWASTAPALTPEDAVAKEKHAADRSKRLQSSQAVAQKAKADAAQRQADAQASKQAAMAETPAQRDPARST